MEFRTYSHVRARLQNLNLNLGRFKQAQIEAQNEKSFTLIVILADSVELLAPIEDVPTILNYPDHPRYLPSLLVVIYTYFGTQNSAFDIEASSKPPGVGDWGMAFFKGMINKLCSRQIPLAAAQNFALACSLLLSRYFLVYLLPLLYILLYCALQSYSTVTLGW